jgi:hypothetical protein
MARVNRLSPDNRRFEDLCRQWSVPAQLMTAVVGAMLRGRRNPGINQFIQGAFLVTSDDLVCDPIYSSRGWFEKMVKEAAPKGRIRPLVCDTDLIKKWIHRCDQYHGKQCKSGDTSATVMEYRTILAHPEIRLIDVERRCLVDLNETQTKTVKSDEIIRYVALSYVWGRNPPG